MIDSSMTHFEISKALFADKPKLQIRAKMLQPRITKQILKENKFPAYKWEEYTHQESHNKYLICFYAPTIERANALEVCYLAFWGKGKNRVVIQWGCWPYRKRGNLESIAIPALCYYSRHFFERYHERVLDNARLSYNELLCLYFSRNQCPIPFEMNEKINRNYKKYGKYSEIAFQVQEGTCFIKSGVEGDETTVGQKDSDFVSVVFYYTFVNKKLMLSTQIEAIREEEAKYVTNLYQNLFEDVKMRTLVHQLNTQR